ncbi:MAG TPA: hypothetical protein VMC84_09150 [Methanocella sp.]|uniref:hypothetical protein n=1 Tax=Methanocella sp. TaxID=2052833 RepID=UPI002C0D835B|nr:hypothetical protein [Methanocella sp.]HTY91329.1 hypothetical protein [Methanocella sp.]
MSRIQPFALPFFALSVMASTDRGSPSIYTIYGQVLDERGSRVNGADVLVESALDRRQTMSGGDGSFMTEICVTGLCDEILVQALFGKMQGTERISVIGGHIAVDIRIKELKI